MNVNVVDGNPCPECGAGHPNRPKVGDKNGDWWWKCYNPDCNVGMYLPRTGETEPELTEEEEQEIKEEVERRIEKEGFKEIKEYDPSSLDSDDDG